MFAPISPDLTLEYEDSGRGAPLVLLHAFPMSNAMWRDQIADLSRDFRIIAPNLRGFGISSPFHSTADAQIAAQSTADAVKTPERLEIAAADVASLLDYLGIDEPIALCGVSMGGYISFAFARQFPQRLRALILADTKAEADNDEAKAKRDEMIQFARDHSPVDVFDKMQANLLGQTTRDSRPDVVSRAREIASALDANAIVAAIEALRDRNDSTATLAQIAVPTLVICGEEDTITPPDGARKMTASIAGARLEIIARAGHLSNLEQSPVFNALLRDFLLSLS